MKTILIILGVGLIGLTLRRIEINYRKQKEKHAEEESRKRQKVEAFKQLKALKKWDANGYVRETKEAIDAFQQKVDSCIETLVPVEDTALFADQILSLEKEGKELAERLEAAHKGIETCLRDLEEKGTYIKEYLDTTNFYPPQFALDNNKLHGMMVEINDRKHQNPLLRIGDYQRFAEHLHQDVRHFQHTHARVVSLMNDIEKKHGQLSPTDQQTILREKNDLYLSLHKGEWKEVDKKMRVLEEVLG